jgi:hypothetical protein
MNRFKMNENKQVRSIGFWLQDIYNASSLDFVRLLEHDFYVDEWKQLNQVGTNQ